MPSFDALFGMYHVTFGEFAFQDPKIGENIHVEDNPQGRVIQV